MKKVLSFYYDLNPINIHQNNKYYKFNIDNIHYILLKVIDTSNIDEIYKINLYLNQRGINNIQIIINKNNSILTFYNNNYYILMKTSSNLNIKITLNDIIYFNQITSNINHINNWYKLWINKMDYFSYQIKELSKKYPKLKESFNYFQGYVETGIQLLVNLNIKNNESCICHNRIKKDDTLFELYNPLNFIIDNKVRDSAEFFKGLINEDPYPLIENYLLNNNLSDDEIRLFFIRLLYPSFYFDIYEEIIKNNKDDSLIDNVINKSEKYEKLIKKTYILIKNICYLPEIEWLVK